MLTFYPGGSWTLGMIGLTQERPESNTTLQWIFDLKALFGHMCYVVHLYVGFGRKNPFKMGYILCHWKG